ncbi:MAG TPA: hypothetical protein DCW52_02495 [Gammaproteobacteria bacterium]|nr:hypothetical protein [Gammaproteobacteria bacterium]
MKTNKAIIMNKSTISMTDSSVGRLETTAKLSQTLAICLKRLAAFTLAFSLSFFAVSNSYAILDAQSFDSPELEQRYNQLIKEFRCLVCQNQSLADSDADLAKDLRQKTADMLRAGKSDAQISSFMQERYGDFVLYRTPFTAYTAFIWVAPLSALLLGLWFFFGRTTKPQQAKSSEEKGATSAALSRAKELLNSPRSDDS